MDKRKRIASIERWLRLKALSNAPALREAVVTTLRLLVERDVISSRDVMQALGCSKQYACRVIDCLVRRHILTTTTPHRRGRGVRYTLAPPRPYDESKQQSSKKRINDLKRISQQAKPISGHASPRKRTCKHLWDDEVLQLRGGQYLIPRRPWMRDYMRLARWEAHKALGGQRCANNIVAAICYRATTAYNLTIERALTMLKAVVSTLKQVIARGRRITVKAVTWAVRRYLVSLCLVRVRSRRRRPDYHRPAGSRRADTGLRTVASLLASALTQSHVAHSLQSPHRVADQVQHQPPSLAEQCDTERPETQRNYVDMSDIVNRYYRAYVQPSPSLAEQCDSSRVRLS